MSASDMAETKMMDDYRGHPPYPKGDFADWGTRFGGRTIGSSLTSMDVRALGLDMPLPFFIVQGREGGHYAGFTNPDAFVGALRKYVRQLAI